MRVGGIIGERLGISRLKVRVELIKEDGYTSTMFVCNIELEDY